MRQFQKRSGHSDRNERPAKASVSTENITRADLRGVTWVKLKYVAEVFYRVLGGNGVKTRAPQSYAWTWIPGAGPFIAAGPIMAALSGAAVGGATGGIIGALVGMGIPELEAKQYEGRLRDGNILISVHTEDGKKALA